MSLTVRPTLRDAAQQALEALEDIFGKNKVDVGAINVLRAALAKEQNENTVQSTGGVHSRVSDGADRGVEAVTDCHEKAADHIPDATKTMASVREDRTVEPVAYIKGYSKGRCIIEAVDPDWLLPVGMALYRSPPTSQESRQDEPVAYCTLEQIAHLKLVVPSDDKIALYTAPPKRNPLTDEEMWDVIGSLADTRLAGPLEKLIRATERAHGIGGEE